MTLREMVETYTGTLTDTTALDKWLSVGVRKVYGLVPIRLLDRVTTPVSIPASGLAVSGFRLSTVVANGVALLRIPLSYKARVLDPRSIHYATAKEPVYYIEDGRLRVLPVTQSVFATAFVVQFPSVTHASESLGAYVFLEVEHAVVLWTAIQARMHQLNGILETVRALALPSREVPVAPALASLTPGGSVTVGEVTVEDVVLELPPFPAFTMDTVPFDFTLPEAPSLTPPVAPEYTALPSTVGFVPPPPSELDLTSVLSALTTAMQQEDVELATGRMNEVRTRLEAHYGAYESYLKGVAAASDVERALVEKQLSDYRARIDAFIAQMNGYVSQIRIGLDYYTARAGVVKAAVDAAVAKFQGEIEGALGIYRGKIEAYTAQVNLAVHKATLAQTRLIEQAKLDESASQAEAARQVNQYRLLLERYAGEVNAYSAGVQSDASGILALAQKAKMDFDGAHAVLQELKGQYAETLKELMQRSE